MSRGWASWARAFSDHGTHLFVVSDENRSFTHSVVLTIKSSLN
jgi:hypothetical protein